MGLIKARFPLMQGYTMSALGTSGTWILQPVDQEQTLLLRAMTGREEKLLVLPDLAGEVILCGNDRAGALVVGSSLGGHIYVVEGQAFEKSCEVSLKRDRDSGERSYECYITPNEQRVVVVSELVIIVLTWTGEVLIAHPLTSTMSFKEIEDGAIRLYDRSLEADVAYKIPAQ